MQLSIISGIYADADPNIRVAYPLNMIPVIEDNGVSGGYLKPADGIVLSGSSSGSCRGGINWNNELYRVFGNNLVKIDSSGGVTIIGDVGNDNKSVTFDYSFDRLSIASNGNLFYYDGISLTQVTDSDLGLVLDSVWVDGYFMTTDGEFLVVTDITNPLSVNPLKYGSSEIDPDKVVALKKIRGEIYAVNRNTVEIFNNIASEFFPFQVKKGAQIPKGAVGTHACCVFNDVLAFVGGGRNEQISVYLGFNSNAQKISTREIDDILSKYTEDQLSDIYIEERNDKDNKLLYIHPPEETLIYDIESTASSKKPIWSVHKTDTSYRARYFVYIYNAWQVADPKSSNFGYFDDTISTHWGQKVNWEFSTQMVYNESRGGIFHELELVALNGNATLGSDPRIRTSYSLDGKSWSQDNWIESGKQGESLKRLNWRRQGRMKNFRIQRFQGDSDTKASFMRLEARLEPLNV